MLEYERIYVLEGINADKSPDESKECNLSHYWYFVDKNFNYRPYLCNGCHDMMMKAVSFNDVVSVKENAYRIRFCFMRRNDAINLLNNSVLSNKGVLLWILVWIKHLLKSLKKVHLEELTLEIFILVLMANGIERVGKNLIH